MADSSLDRQKALNLKIPDSVAVIGCGGVGSWTAYLLALAGVPKLWLFDPDWVEETNLNRLPFSREHIGKLKSTATAELINTVRDTVCYPLSRFTPRLATQIQLSNSISWIVATTDTLDSRLEAYKWAKQERKNYIEAAAEGEIGSATGKPAEWRTAAEDNPGYASVPVWVGPCISGAMVAVTHILHNSSMNDQVVRLGWEQEKFLTYNSKET